MKQVIAKVNFTYCGKRYIIGDVIENLNINQIRVLNEQGFIEPLSYEDLVKIERQLNKEEL